MTGGGLDARELHAGLASGGYQREIRFLELESSPAFVREPRGNGCIGHCPRTSEDQLLGSAALTR